jgi:hypothetical protein
MRKLFPVATILYFLASTCPRQSAAAEESLGYVCNLCHSLANEHPYPPPSLEEKNVYLPLKFGGKKWQPGQAQHRQPTCLQLWMDGLDSAIPGVSDEKSCREMAAMFAPQCCNEYLEEETSNGDENNNNNNNNIVIAASFTDALAARTSTTTHLRR